MAHLRRAVFDEHVEALVVVSDAHAVGGYPATARAVVGELSGEPAFVLACGAVDGAGVWRDDTLVHLLTLRHVCSAEFLEDRGAVALRVVRRAGDPPHAVLLSLAPVPGNVAYDLWRSAASHYARRVTGLVQRRDAAGGGGAGGAPPTQPVPPAAHREQWVHPPPGAFAPRPAAPPLHPAPLATARPPPAHGGNGGAWPPPAYSYAGAPGAPSGGGHAGSGAPPPAAAAWPPGFGPQPSHAPPPAHATPHFPVPPAAVATTAVTVTGPHGDGVGGGRGGGGLGLTVRAPRETCYDDDTTPGSASSSYSAAGGGGQHGGTPSAYSGGLPSAATYYGGGAGTVAASSWDGSASAGPGGGLDTPAGVDNAWGPGGPRGAGGGRRAGGGTPGSAAPAPAGGSGESTPAATPVASAALDPISRLLSMTTTSKADRSGLSRRDYRKLLLLQHLLSFAASYVVNGELTAAAATAVEAAGLTAAVVAAVVAAARDAGAAGEAAGSGSGFAAAGFGGDDDDDGLAARQPGGAGMPLPAAAHAASAATPAPGSGGDAASAPASAAHRVPSWPPAALVQTSALAAATAAGGVANPLGLRGPQGTLPPAAVAAAVTAVPAPAGFHHAASGGGGRPPHGTDERDSGARRAALRCIATLADVPSWAPAFDDAVLDALVAAVEVDGDAAAAGWALRALQGLSADVDADLGRYGTRLIRALARHVSTRASLAAAVDAAREGGLDGAAAAHAALLALCGCCVKQDGFVEGDYATGDAVPALAPLLGDVGAAGRARGAPSVAGASPDAHAAYAATALREAAQHGMTPGGSLERQFVELRVLPRLVALVGSSAVNPWTRRAAAKATYVLMQRPGLVAGGGLTLDGIMLTFRAAEAEDFMVARWAKAAAVWRAGGERPAKKWYE